MQNAIIDQLPGIITGVITTIVGVLLGVYVTHRLVRHQQPKLEKRTFSFSRSLSDLKDVMEDIHLQFSLSHTILIEPTIPSGLNISKRHSHTSNGYFEYLIQNNIKTFIFKYWDGTDKKRTIKLAVDGNKLKAELFMLPHEINDMVKILEKQL